jgi:hypothetical protein
MRWEENIAHMGGKRNAHKTAVGKSEGKRPLGRSKRTWQENIKNYLKEIGWIHPILDRDKWRTLANTAINLRVSITRRGMSFNDTLPYYLTLSLCVTFSYFS